LAGRLVILDRDGVINHDSDAYIKSPAEWVPIDGALDAIARLTQAGFTVAVATNQSGIGRKLFDVPALEAIHQRMRDAVREAGGDLGRIAWCPHRPDAGCDCRKPAPGLLRDLSRQYGVSLDGTPVIGDSLRDLDSALAVGARPILVLTGNGRQTQAALAAAGRKVETWPSLAEAADAIIVDSGRRQ